MSTSVLRVALIALASGSLTLLPEPSERAASAKDAPDLATFLALRASLPVAVAPGVEGASPGLVTAKFGARASELLFGAAGLGPTTALDARIGPVSRALRDLAVPAGAAVALLARDEALGSATDAFAEAIAAAGYHDAVACDGGAAGQCPYGHLAMVERLAAHRVAVVVSVVDLEGDLAEADLVRRVHTNAAASGDVDTLRDALRDPGRRAAAQEAWLGSEPGAAEEVVAALATIGAELDRRAWLLGGAAAVVLLAPREPAGPATRAATDALCAALTARQVVYRGVAAQRDPRGVVEAAALPGLLAEALRAARER